MIVLFDLAILGGGLAGYLAAERAGEAGLSVALFEKREIGGVCLNEGCVPSKTLLYSAKLYDGANHGEAYGVTAAGLKLDHAKVIARKQTVVDSLVGGIKMKLKKLKVETVQAEAVLTGRTADGIALSAAGKEYTAKNLLIATGSETFLPPVEGLKESVAAGFALTNREILSLPDVPESLTVIGGGVIGLEMASYYNSAGSKVTVIEMLDHIAGATDGEIGNILRKNYEKKGIEFILSAKVTRLASGAVTYEKDGVQKTAAADKVLVSVGRRPVTQGLGLETLGVNVERGAVKTDDRCRTNAAGVYAAGDVNGVSMLAHTAYREAEVAVNNLLGIKDVMSYDAIPSVIYTNPEVGCVGLTEDEAKKRGLSVKTAKLTMRYSGRYVAENEGGDGIIKLIADADKNVIIGCHAIGSYAGEFIVAAGILVEMRVKLSDVKKIVFPHPTVCEMIREAVFELR
jgi:dihydrolipoamide dehydrogenase